MRPSCFQSKTNVGKHNAPTAPALRERFPERHKARRMPCLVRRLAFLAIALAFGLASPCLAGSGQMSGTASDALGRPLARVSIELRDQNGVVVARGTTDQSGRFRIAPAKAGVYSLVAAKPGFASANKIVTFPQTAGETVSLTLGAQTALTLPV